MLLCTKFLHTSFRAILVHRHRCSSNCFSLYRWAPKCLYTSFRTILVYTVLVVRKTVLIMLLCTKCLYTSIWWNIWPIRIYKHLEFSIGSALDLHKYLLGFSKVLHRISSDLVAWRRIWNRNGNATRAGEHGWRSMLRSYHILNVRTTLRSYLVLSCPTKGSHHILCWPQLGWNAHAKARIVLTVLGVCVPQAKPNMFFGVLLRDQSPHVLQGAMLGPHRAT